MEKQKLTNLINKYLLGDRNQTVRWNFNEDGNVQIDAKYEGMLRVRCNYDGFDEKDITLGIVDTSGLLKILGAVDDKFDFKVGFTKNKPTNITLSDSAIDVNYTLGDLDVIPDVNETSQIKFPREEAICTFEMDKETINRFIKGMNGIKDVKTFSIIMDDSGLDLVINWAEQNTNRISLHLGANVVSVFSEPMTYSIELFSDILNVNKDFTENKIYLLENGMLIDFIGDGWKTTYIMPKYI